MASWTDKMPQFNPYIQQMPVEAMSQVGMYKQQQYNQGLEKIQGQIENVAGLDIIRDVDKKYLESKLNELGGKLNTVAAGDFSNFQLVNSVGGMTNQIAKDKSIQSAVSSTSRYRKQLTNMETAIKEGKSSQSNIFDFNTKASNWLNSMEVGKSFDDRYVQYKNVKTTAMEAIKALHPKLSQYDIPFKINDDGTINKKLIADAMKRYKIEGVDENQIAQAITASLTPDDINQLGIDANYQFRGVTSQDLVKKAKDNYTAKKEDAIVTLNYLRKQKEIISDPVVNKKISDQIKDYENLLGKDGVLGLLDEELNSNIEIANNNPEAVKLSIYKDGFIKEFGNAFSWKNQVQEYIKSPLRDQLNFVEEMSHKRQVENRMRWKDEQDLMFKKEELRLKSEEVALQKIALYGDAASTTWTPLGTGTDNTLMSKEYFTDHVESVASNVNNTLSKLRTRYDDVQINEMLDDLKKNPNNPTKVKADAMGLIHELARQKNYLTSLEEKDKQLRKEAEIKVAKKKAADPSYQAELKEKEKNEKSINEGNPIPISLKRYVEGGRGQLERIKINKTPSEILKDVQSGVATLDFERGPGVGEIKVKYNINGKTYTTSVAKSALAVQSEEGASEMRKPLTEIVNHIDKFRKVENSYIDDVDKEYRNALAPIVTTLVPEIKALARDKNGKLPPVMFDRVSALITASNELKIGADEKYSSATSEEMLADENIKDTKIFIYRQGDGYEVHLKNPKVDKENIQKLKLNASDVARYFGPEYVSDKTQASVRINLGKGNTNLTSDPNRSILQKSFGDFPNITKYNVTGDLNEDLSNPNLYIPSLNLMDKQGNWYNFQVSGPDKKRKLGYDQGVRQFNTLTNESLINLIQESHPDFDFSIF